MTKEKKKSQQATAVVAGRWIAAGSAQAFR